MLTKIQVEHFKCFEKLSLPLSPLTLLSGLNAAGKSSVMQSLALLHQTIVENEWSTDLILNGNLVTLGTASDVINKITGRNQFSIGIETDKCHYLWVMEAAQRTEALTVPIKIVTFRESPSWQWNEILIPTLETSSSRDIISPDYIQPLQRLISTNDWRSSEAARYLAASLFRLSYISADRIAPRETYSVSAPDQLSGVGIHGEYTPWYLYHHADKQPLEGLILKDSPPTLQRQAEAWLRRFFPGTSLKVDPVKGTNLMLMGIRTSDATDFHRPQNVGYGITHVLPILTACLGADKDDLILIENPESHLHPAGQSAIGVFLAKVAAAGIQVILETHSDHILNGVRRAVKDQLISPESVAIHFFIPKDENSNAPQVTSPVLDADGVIDHWPNGFFDQFDKDTAALINW